MAVTALKHDPETVREQVGDTEWQARVDLAAIYRLVAKHGMTDLTATHISARIPGTEDQFLLNPYGVLFDQITASSLVKIDVDGQILLDNGYSVNAAGFCIHSAVHMARHDVDCVAHTHTPIGMAISAVPGGLLPMSQKSMRFYKRVAYHPFEGIANDLDERERLIADLGDKDVLILDNHGFLVCGKTIRQAWTRLYNLEKATKAQMAAQATGARIRMPSPELCDHVYGQFQSGDSAYRQDGWESQLRLLDRLDPSFRQ